jgi:hypothetical protein
VFIDPKTPHLCSILQKSLMSLIMGKTCGKG